MGSDIEKNQTLTEIVSEEQFNKTIRTFLNKRHDKDKPLWTREIIEEAIKSLNNLNKHHYLNCNGHINSTIMGKNTMLWK